MFFYRHRSRDSFRLFATIVFIGCVSILTTPLTAAGVGLPPLQTLPHAGGGGGGGWERDSPTGTPGACCQCSWGVLGVPGYASACICMADDNVGQAIAETCAAALYEKGGPLNYVQLNLCVGALEECNGGDCNGANEQSCTPQGAPY